MIAAAKIVDDVFSAAPISKAKSLVDHIHSQLRLGTIVYGPTCFELYGLKIEQMFDIAFDVSSSRKFNILSQYTIEQNRRKQSDEELSKTEIFQSRSMNGKLCWICVISSSFCAFASFYPSKNFLLLV